MAVTTNILRSYVAPRQVLRRLIISNETDDRPEARGFIYLLVGCLIIYLSQVPALVTTGEGVEGAAPMDARLAITFFAWLFVWPLIFYIIGGISHLIAKALGGKGRGADARLALFWAVLAASPLFLLRALAELAGASAGAVAMGVIIAAVFLFIWLLGLIEAEQGDA